MAVGFLQAEGAEVPQWDRAEKSYPRAHESKICGGREALVWLNMALQDLTEAAFVNQLGAMEGSEEGVDSSLLFPCLLHRSDDPLLSPILYTWTRDTAWWTTLVAPGTGCLPWIVTHCQITICTLSL